MFINICANTHTDATNKPILLKLPTVNLAYSIESANSKNKSSLSICLLQVQIQGTFEEKAYCSRY